MSSKHKTGRLAIAALVVTATGLIAAPSSAAPTASASQAPETAASAAKSAKKYGPLQCRLMVRLEGRNKAHPNGVIARAKAECNFRSPRIAVRAALIRKPGSNNRHTNVGHKVKYKRSLTFIPCSNKTRYWKARGFARIAPPKHQGGKPKVTVKRTKWSEGLC